MMKQLKSLTHFSFQHFSLLLIVASLAFSCVQGDGQRSKSKTQENVSNPNTGGSGNGGVGSLPIDDAGLPTEALQSVNIELSHLIDPFSGTYKKKVTIPKNYRGELYIAGLNVAALSDKIVKVRFYFGLDRQSITLPATLSRAPGIIPQTNIQVLSVDMNSAPFSTWRLAYDLYDYNNYETDSSGFITDKPVASNLDGGLYCRALALQYDPTFAGPNSTCSGSSDKCLYAYAKVSDTTLFNSSGVASMPDRPQVWSMFTGTKIPSTLVSASSMCLPDQRGTQFLSDMFGPFDPLGVTGPSFDSVTGELKIGSSEFFYRGPYRHINQGQWRISGSAVYNNRHGLFADGSVVEGMGYQSFLFPRAGNLNLAQGTHYLKATAPFIDLDSGSTNLLTTNSTGLTNYMNGCNVRAQNYNSTTTEGIGSCTVNANIEVFYERDGAEIIVTRSSSIKLQIVRASQTNYQGKDVLASTFKRCESSSTCGGDECCYNNRCWSKDLVTQCVDKIPVIGNQEIGANCSSDFECGSLCCNQGTGSCAAHDPNGTAPVLCNKTSGQTCVTKDFCKPEYVSTCKLVKLPNLNSNGQVQCRVQCTPVLTYGTCTSGRCNPPKTPEYPTNVDDCSQAVDP